MKTRLIVFTVLTLQLLTVTLQLNAQKYVTHFLDIPVDGSKEDMIEKLKAKGFKKANGRVADLTGQFNGSDVEILIATNNNKVSRVVVSDKLMWNETDIRIRFNNLLNQFLKNNRYSRLIGSDTSKRIPSDEDISYQMTVNNKRYEAVFYQRPKDNSDSTEVARHLAEQLIAKFGKEKLANKDEGTSDEVTKYFSEALMEYYSKSIVWFAIQSAGSKYFISIFYDNEYNKANGDDL